MPPFEAQIAVIAIRTVKAVIGHATTVHDTVTTTRLETHWLYHIAGS